jgi:hypothetical protein
MGVIMNNMFFVTFFIITCTSFLLVLTLFLDKISLNNELEALVKYNNKKQVDEDAKKYIINVDPVFNKVLHDRKSAIEKMSQVQLVLDKDKIYKRTILK